MPVISCNHIESIEWKNSAAEPFAGFSSVQVWSVRISEHRGRLAEYAQLLSDEEKTRAASYASEKDKERFIVSRGFLRTLLGKYLRQLPSEIALKTGVNKKPFAASAGGNKVHYSLSHAGDNILIAVSDKGVGIDIECIDPAFSFEGVLQVSFSDQEIKAIQESEPAPTTFYRYWTRKEALVKATGKGIDDDMARIPCLDGNHNAATELIESTDNWVVSSFLIGDNYAGSVAYDASGRSIVFRT